MTDTEKTFDELMRTSYDDLGIEGSPFTFPAVLRRFAAWVVSFDYRLFAVAIWSLHRCWGIVGLLNRHPIAVSWCRLARKYSLKDALGIATAVRDLDKHATFRNGCQTLQYRNCLQAMFYRGSFVDAFFSQGEWTRTEFTHPLQRPSHFVPGIPSHRFYEAESFEWKDRLEAAYDEIREEVVRLMNDHNQAFGTFHAEFDTSVAGWNTFNFYVNGRRQTANCELCPKSAEIADAMLEFEEGELTMFSALNAGSYIPPHVGPLNGILRVHLPLLVSPECGLRVGGEDVTWEAGKILIFDDSFVHNVWNHSEEVRVVLFFNAWHPCLSKEERLALANLRRAYNDTPIGRHWLKHQEKSRPSTFQSMSAGIAS